MDVAHVRVAYDRRAQRHRLAALAKLLDSGLELGGADRGTSGSDEETPPSEAGIS